MFSSGRRGQVQPLPALLALAVFAIGLSLYGTTVTGLSLDSGPEVSEATMTQIRTQLSDGPVVVPARMERLDGAVPGELSVTLRAADQTWHWGAQVKNPQRTRRAHVLVRTDIGEVPGILRVEV